MTIHTAVLTRTQERTACRGCFARITELNRTISPARMAGCCGCLPGPWRTAPEAVVAPEPAPGPGSPQPGQPAEKEVEGAKSPNRLKASPTPATPLADDSAGPAGDDPSSGSPEGQHSRTPAPDEAPVVRAFSDASSEEGEPSSSASPPPKRAGAGVQFGADGDDSESPSKQRDQSKSAKRKNKNGGETRDKSPSRSYSFRRPNKGEETSPRPTLDCPAGAGCLSRSVGGQYSSRK